MLFLVVVALLATLFVLPASANIAYRIEEGDTLAKVAEKTGIPLKDLLAWNEWVEDPNAVLKVGKLVVLRNPYGLTQFEKDPEIRAVSEMLTAFFDARLAKDLDSASKYVSGEVLKKYREGEGGLSLFGTSTPSLARYAISSIEKKKDGTFLANVRLYETAGGKEVGYFDERLTVAKVDGALKVVSTARGEYTNVYVVERGDNLWIIAQKLGKKSNAEIATFIKKVMELNDLEDKDFLQVHQVLKLPR